jgi:hypothetical protein
MLGNPGGGANGVEMPMPSVHLGSRAVRVVPLAVLLVLLAAGAVVGAAALDDDTRDDAPGTSVTTSSTSGDGTDPSVTPSTGVDPSTTGSTTTTPEDDGRFDVEPLEPENPLVPGTTPPTEGQKCIPEPWKACLHDGAGPADQ